MEYFEIRVVVERQLADKYFSLVRIRTERWLKGTLPSAVLLSFGQNSSVSFTELYRTETNWKLGQLIS